MPCVFALLPNKTQITYRRLFGEITQHMQGHIPTDFHHRNLIIPRWLTSNHRPYLQSEAKIFVTNVTNYDA